MLIISNDLAASLMTFEEVVDAVQAAFQAYDDNTSILFDVVRGYAATPKNFFAIKSGSHGPAQCYGLKIGSYFPDNHHQGLAAHSSTILLLDSMNGLPVALIGANGLNGMRTSAANALAVRHLSRQDSEVLGVLGTGHQAVFEVLAVCKSRPIRKILFWSPSDHHHQRFIEHIRKDTGLVPEYTAIDALNERSDIIITVTPSRSPLIRADHVRPGTHISAMGADADGKQELDINLFKTAKVFVDIPGQAKTIGECQHAYKAGLLSDADLDQNTLGGLLNRKILGRTSEQDITVFDSSGMALQDLAVADLIYRKATAKSSSAIRVEF